MTMRLTTALRTLIANQYRDQIDAGAGPGTVKFYTGTQPAGADDGLSGNTLLATLTFSDPSAPDASAGVLTFGAITQDSSADATGPVAWARVEDSDGNNVLDGDITITGGGGTIEINTVDIVSGGPVRITSFTITVPTE